LSARDAAAAASPLGSAADARAVAAVLSEAMGRSARMEHATTVGLARGVWLLALAGLPRGGWAWQEAMAVSQGLTALLAQWWRELGDGAVGADWFALQSAHSAMGGDELQSSRGALEGALKELHRCEVLRNDARTITVQQLLRVGNVGSNPLVVVREREARLAVDAAARAVVAAAEEASDAVFWHYERMYERGVKLARKARARAR
jgi:hypothetical protein